MKTRVLCLPLKTLLAALFVIIMIAPAQSWAYQPIMVDWQISEANASGSAMLSPGFDTYVLILLRNRDQEHGAIVHFPSCTFDREPGGIYLFPDVYGASFFEPSWQACFPELPDFAYNVYLPPEARTPS